MDRLVRRVAVVCGVVQGVGFRPTVYRLARAWSVAGWVRNRTDGVEIVAEGSSQAVEGFLAALADHPPPQARITRIKVEEAEPAGSAGFMILPSAEGSGSTLCPPDLATCDACVRELLDPTDRRYRYPFITCTDCGPRFTAVTGLPYDRPLTSMACFPMCERCSAEYHDPMDRRYHAQTNACPACGPTVWLVDPRGEPVPTEDPVLTLAALLRQGSVAAIKGIGGFHLAADATDEAAVERLRRLKGRDAKPLAVMVGDLTWARRCAEIDAIDERALTSRARPIVVLPAADDTPLASAIAPGIKTVGLMLPYSPLHHLLFRAGRETLPPLVMTSGNLSDEPIAVGNREALGRLGRCADLLLLHDRDIVARADDSVVQRSPAGSLFIRRSRGFVPQPIELREDLVPSVGTGAFLKASPCLISGRQAFVGAHVGDLSTVEAVRSHAQTIAHLQSLMHITPTVAGCDLNPDFPSSTWAAESGLRVEPVQHHHAHVVAAALEHGLLPPILGLAIDGTGLGTDGSVWGCELLLAHRTDFERVGHAEEMPLPGGDAAVREPWRAAVGALCHAFGDEALDAAARLFPTIDGARVRGVAVAARRGVNTPLHSSCGRLFDIVAALTGVCPVARFEAEAPMRLERLCGSAGYRRSGAEPYPFEVDAGPVVRLRLRPMIRQIVGDVMGGSDPADVARRFHDTMVRGLSALTLAGASKARVDSVVLTGGCMLNRYLAGGLLEELQAAGLRVLVPMHLPVGDGGISLGQAAIAAWRTQA